MADSELLRCSFCRKNQNDVRKLIAGPSVYICDECVAVCLEIIADDSRLTDVTLLEPPDLRVTAPQAPGLVVRCSLCKMPASLDDVLPIPNRGVLCLGCIGEVQATMAERSGES